jgi:hypothetical protein
MGKNIPGVQVIFDRKGIPSVQVISYRNSYSHFVFMRGKFRPFKIKIYTEFIIIISKLMKFNEEVLRPFLKSKQVRLRFPNALCNKNTKIRTYDTLRLLKILTVAEVTER